MLKMVDATGVAICSTAVGASAALKNREQVIEFMKDSGDYQVLGSRRIQRQIN